MALSNLTSSEAELLAEIANNYGADPVVSASSEEPAEIVGAWYAAVVGGSNPYLNMSVPAMIAGIRNELVGGSKSHLTSSVGELFADIASDVQGSTVSRYTTSSGGMLSIISGGSGEPSDPLEVTDLTVEDVGLTSARLVFTAPAEAYYYAVINNGGSLVTSFIADDIVNGGYDLTGLAQGTSYSLQLLVAPFDESTEVLSNSAAFITATLAIADLTVEDVTSTSARLVFTPPVFAASFEVYSIVGEDGTLLDSFETADIVDGGYTVSGLSSDTAYDVMLFAYDAGAEQGVSDLVSFTTLAASGAVGQPLGLLLALTKAA